MNSYKFSYAQNFEDIYIFKIRNCFLEIFNGICLPKTFIDIGANHPQIDSVSKYFIDDDWNGLLVEPNPFYYDLLLKEYKDNLNVKVFCNVISGNSGEVREFYIPEKTAGHASLIKENVNGLNENFQTLKIKSKSIDDLFDYFDDSVFFVKLDVEGAEYEILSNWKRDIQVFLFIVERPNSQTINLLRRKKYKFIFFDGLNGYFIPESLSRDIEINPINVVDDLDWVTPSGWLSRASNEKLLRICGPQIK